ncbi:uncharacterized protein DS421_11g323540 [Arachis hypogaea]|nr:uncharacterized protein DS421_11g323540 [Arachis hypogaea]
MCGDPILLHQHHQPAPSCAASSNKKKASGRSSGILKCKRSRIQKTRLVFSDLVDERSEKINQRNGFLCIPLVAREGSPLKTRDGARGGREKRDKGRERNIYLWMNRHRKSRIRSPDDLFVSNFEILFENILYCTMVI